MAMMQASAHAYAYHMFVYFEHMAKVADTDAQKAYYKQCKAVAGCMVHGPHGVQPVPMHAYMNCPPPPPFFGSPMG